MKAIDQKIVVVTRQTRMRALKARFGTRGMAKFAMVRAREIELAAGAKAPSQDPGAVFEELEMEDVAYGAAVDRVRDELDLNDLGLKVQPIDREFVPNFVFGPKDIVVTLGQDGLVANTAKYALGLPIVAVNPDPARIDGILLPFAVSEARSAVRAVVQGKARYREATLAEARLTDGQRLLAFNDLFVGVRTHVSARYRLRVGNEEEQQSSSGILISTGAGSTGWLSSVLNMAAGVDRLLGRPVANAQLRLSWDERRLVYGVREPFVSKTSTARIVAGTLGPDQELLVESMVASDGVIFSDGIENDYLEFNSGAIAHLRLAPQRAKLVVP